MDMSTPRRRRYDGEYQPIPSDALVCFVPGGTIVLDNFGTRMSSNISIPMYPFQPRFVPSFNGLSEHVQVCVNSPPPMFVNTFFPTHTEQVYANPFPSHQEPISVKQTQTPSTQTQSTQTLSTQTQSTQTETSDVCYGQTFIAPVTYIEKLTPVVFNSCEGSQPTIEENNKFVVVNGKYIKASFPRTIHVDFHCVTITSETEGIQQVVF